MQMSSEKSHLVSNLPWHSDWRQNVHQKERLNDQNLGGRWWVWDMRDMSGHAFVKPIEVRITDPTVYPYKRWTASVLPNTAWLTD